MNAHIKEIATVLQTYEYIGKVNEDESAAGWEWKDLFTSEGRDALVWKIEVFDMFATVLSKVVENPNYQHGVMFAAEIVGPSEPKMPYESPWWSWYGAKDLKERYASMGDELIFDLAIKATKELYGWFSSWPHQETLIIHNAHQVEKKVPLVMEDE